MANEENLTHKLTESEQRKGGLKSGEVRRRKKTLREELELLLATGSTQKKISTALIDEAMKGNTKAFEVIRDTIGEKPVEKVMHAEVDPSVVAEVEAIVNAERSKK